MMDVLVIVGPGVVADRALLGEVAEREFAALGVSGRMLHAHTATDVQSHLPPPKHPTPSPPASPSPEGFPESGPGVTSLPPSRPGAIPPISPDPGTTRPTSYGPGQTPPGPPSAGPTPLGVTSPSSSRPGVASPTSSRSEEAPPVESQVGTVVVVVPGPTDEVRQLMAGSSRVVVWVDLTREDDAPEGAVHLHGRGIGGLTWAIRHAVHRAVRPCRRVPYGAHRDQWAELHLPDEAKGRLPVVALLHGGYWRSIWGADLMDALCADLATRGFAVWNLEYRRPDLHGWSATTADVAAGLDALSTVDAPLNLDKVAVVGHSAGGQLALRAAADGARVALAVSLAGVLDLVEGERRWLSSGAIAAALGHTTPPHEPHPGAAAPQEVQAGAATLRGVHLGVRTPYEVHAGASPLLRLPMKVPQLIVQGSSDDLDLVDFGRRYARAAKEGGDTITYLEMSGDHFAVIDPKTPIWRTTALAIADALR